MKEKCSKIILILLLILILISLNIGCIFAASKSELEQQQSDIDKQIEETNSEIAAKKSQMSTALNQINDLNAQIATAETEIDSLQSQIDSLNAQITEKQANIELQEQKYAEQKDLLDKRLVALYENGDTSYLSLLLTSDSLSDFISRYYIIEQIAEYDDELLQNIDDLKNQITTEKENLETTKSTIESSQNEIVNKKSSLSASKTQKDNLVSNLSDEEKDLEEQLEQFEKDKKEIAAKIAALSKSSKKAGAPSAAGYICPIAGKSKANITTGYYGYSGHTGVDFACAGGTPILAAKSGTVVISTALKTSSGSYRSYGEYIVIDHNDGTMTLYAHMQPNSRLVSVGQSVSQGQQIGSVGTTGNSTGNHLHFEVFANGSRVNPTPYLP